MKQPKQKLMWLDQQVNQLLQDVAFLGSFGFASRKFVNLINKYSKYIESYISSSISLFKAKKSNHYIEYQFDKKIIE